MANPFYVQPGNDFGTGLQSLARTVTQTGQIMDERQQRQKQEETMTQAKAALTQALQSGDPSKVRDVAVQYPEIANAAKQAFGITNETTEEIARDTYTRVMADPENAQQHLDAGIQQVANAGGNPINMVQDYAMFQTNPETALKRIQMSAPLFGLGDDGLSVSQKEYNALVDTLRPAMDESGNIDPSNLTSEQRAAAIKLRLVPGATGSASITAATTPGLGERVTGFEAGKAGATAGASEQARLSAQRAMLPDVQAAVEERVQEVRRESKKLEAFDKKVSDAGGVKDILEMADPLLEKATSSLAGVGLDKLGQLVGLSSEGAEAAAQLKTLEGALILKMPRMEGPQSDRDQALYRQMAAQIGDATVPARIRKAAMETLKELNDKYQDQAMVIPVGIDESIWSAMTPEERAAFE